MIEIQQTAKRLESIGIKVGKYEYNLGSLKEELEAVTQQIYQTVEKASKKDREELYDLIMLKNIIKVKMEHISFLIKTLI